MFTFIRAILSIVSLLILAFGVYFLWSWYQGDLVRGADGAVRRVREDWRLWTGLALGAWSFLGRFPLLLLLARRDRDPLRLDRGEGEIIESPTGARLFVERLGPVDAPVLVLTHGWSMDSTIWHYAKRDLATRFHVIVWDLPGLGKSSRGKSKVDLIAMAADLETVISLASAPVTLIGHSIGGMIIQTLARENPRLFARTVNGVVLLNTTYTNPLRTMILSGLLTVLRWPIIEPLTRIQIWLAPLAWFSSWQSYLSGSALITARLGYSKAVTRSQLDRTALLMTRNSPAVQAHGDLAMFRWDGRGVLAALDVPLLVISGRKDIITKCEAGQAISDSARHAQFKTSEGANHMGPIDHADEYHSAIFKFASQAPTQRTARG